jgi:hypothetical protein
MEYFMIDQMFYVVLTSLVTLGMMTFLIQAKNTKAKIKKQDEHAKRISDIKRSFKTTLDLFSMQRIIRPMHVDNLYAIVNNYFVAHPVNEQNIKRLESLANRIAITIAQEVNMSNSEEETEWLKKKLLNFAILVPKKGRDFNRNFYQNRITVLLRGLNTTKSSFIQRHARAA